MSHVHGPLMAEAVVGDQPDIRFGEHPPAP
jgi:hypothetical protein